MASTNEAATHTPRCHRWPRVESAMLGYGSSVDTCLLYTSSMGRYDLVEQVLSDLKAEFFFTGAKIQPGRPVVFGQVGSCESGSCGAGTPAREGASAPLSHQDQHRYFFGLPGNPVSTMVTFELFAKPVIEALGGMSPRPLTFLPVSYTHLCRFSFVRGLPFLPPATRSSTSMPNSASRRFATPTPIRWRYRSRKPAAIPCSCPSLPTNRAVCGN